MHKFEKLGVVHRQISLSSIKIRFHSRSSQWKFSHLDDFELAMVLRKKDDKITQKLENISEGFLAPEIAREEPHN